MSTQGLKMKNTPMTHTVIALGLCVLPFVSAQADSVLVEPVGYDPTIDYDPTIMVGVAYTLNGKATLDNLGFTAQVISSNKENKWVGALGATFYPWSAKQFGVALGVGRNFENSTALIGYDFLKAEPLLGAGWANTKGERNTTPF